MAGRAGVPDDAGAVALNVTVDAARGSGFVTVFACGVALPTASNLNYVTGQTIANAVVARVGANGAVCFYTDGATDLIVDVAGEFPATDLEQLSAPQRLLDTRPGLSTSDGLFAGGGVRPAESTLQLPVAGRAGVPESASAVVLNVTADAAVGDGFVTDPRGRDRTSERVEPELPTWPDDRQRGDRARRCGRPDLPLHVRRDSSGRRRRRLADRPAAARERQRMRGRLVATDHSADHAADHPTHSPDHRARHRRSRRTQAPPRRFTTDAAVAPSSVSRGGVATATTWVTSSAAATVLVALEVYNPAGALVYEQSYDTQSFAAGERRAVCGRLDGPADRAIGRAHRPGRRVQPRLGDAPSLERTTRPRSR